MNFFDLLPFPASRESKSATDRMLDAIDRNEQRQLNRCGDYYSALKCALTQNTLIHRPDQQTHFNWHGKSFEGSNRDYFLWRVFSDTDLPMWNFAFNYIMNWVQLSKTRKLTNSRYNVYCPDPLEGYGECSLYLCDDIGDPRVYLLSPYDCEEDDYNFDYFYFYEVEEPKEEPFNDTLNSYNEMRFTSLCLNYYDYHLISKDKKEDLEYYCDPNIPVYHCFDIYTVNIVDGKREATLLGKMPYAGKGEI